MSELYLRPGTKDAEAVENVRNEYAEFRIPTLSTVLDIGAHIGLFARLAYAQGAKRVVSVEPDADNFQSLLKNISSPTHVAIRAAVVGDSEPSVLLHLAKSMNKAKHSILKHGRWETEVAHVPAINFGELLRFAHPDVLKVDVEGAEYNYYWQDVPAYVQHLAVEFHELPKRVSDMSFIEGTLSRMGLHLDRIVGAARSYQTRFYRR